MSELPTRKLCNFNLNNENLNNAARTAPLTILIVILEVHYALECPFVRKLAILIFWRLTNRPTSQDYLKNENWMAPNLKVVNDSCRGFLQNSSENHIYSS